MEIIMIEWSGVGWGGGVMKERTRGKEITKARKCNTFIYKG